jgi:predicted nucleic acid-binding protein
MKIEEMREAAEKHETVDTDRGHICSQWGMRRRSIAYKISTEGCTFMRKPRIYLETTIFNYYFDTERDAHPYTVKLFEEIAAGKYTAFTSAYVVRELMSATEPKRSKMLALIEQYGIQTFGQSDEAEQLAEMYTGEGIIPWRFLTDGIHIACATVYDLDMILSLNFRHIVRKKTIELTEFVNVREGYRKVQIYTPMEVVDDE